MKVKIAFVIAFGNMQAMRSLFWINLLVSLGAAFVARQRHSSSSVLRTYNPIEINSVLLAAKKGGKEKRSKSWEQRWDDKFESLKAFHEKFGHTRVPRKEDPQLADWVTIQEENFLLGAMRQDRMERLSTLGFEATSVARASTNDSALNLTAESGKNDAVERRPTKSSSSSSSSWERRWEEMYQKLKIFKEQSGHANVRSSDDPKLVNWVQIQQENLRRGVMRQDRKVKLEEVGVVAQNTDLLDSVSKAFADEDDLAVDSISKMYTNSVQEQKSATARHILVKSKEDVQTVLKALESREGTFQQLAQQYSTCPSGKQSGGLLGTFPPGKMVPEFDKVIFDKDSKLGEVLGPVQTLFGYHLIIIEKRTGV